jgi:hypothetical protein
MSSLTKCKKCGRWWPSNYECPCQTSEQGKEKKRDYKIRAVDFDGTLCENKWPEIGPMNMLLIYYLIDCQKKGDKIILWTCRIGEKLNNAVQACNYYGLRFDAINENLPEVLEWMVTDSRKIYADEYIDARSSDKFQLPFVKEGTPNNICIVDFVERMYGIELLQYQKDILNMLYGEHKIKKTTSEFCAECVHFNYCYNAERMTNIMYDTTVLVNRGLLVINDSKVQELGNKIRCANWQNVRTEILSRDNVEDSSSCPIIDDGIIEKIEQAVGFKLYDWQVHCLKGGYAETNGGRGNGHTFVHCLRILLSPNRKKLIY